MCVTVTVHAAVDVVRHGARSFSRVRRIAWAGDCLRSDTLVFRLLGQLHSAPGPQGKRGSPVAIKTERFRPLGIRKHQGQQDLQTLGSLHTSAYMSDQLQQYNKSSIAGSQP